MDILLQLGYQRLLFNEEIEHAISMYGCKRVPSLALCGIIRTFRDQYQAFPDLESLLIYQYEPCVETCEFSVPMEDAIPILIHGVMEFGTLFSCQMIYLFNLFQFTEGRYPRLDEIDMNDVQTNATFSQQMTDTMHHHVDEYWNQKVSALDKSILSKKIVEVKKEESCVICQEELKKDQTVIELPCSHVFHSKNGDCPGIEEWLTKINACPLCKIPV